MILTKFAITGTNPYSWNLTDPWGGIILYKGTTGKLYHPMFLSSDRYQMPTYRVAHVLCYISVSISPTIARNLRKNVHLFTISPHIIDINKRTSVCLLSISGFQLGDGLSSPKNHKHAFRAMLPFSPYVGLLIDVRRQMLARHSVFGHFGASRLAVFVWTPVARLTKCWL